MLLYVNFIRTGITKFLSLSYMRNCLSREEERMLTVRTLSFGQPWCENLSDIYFNTLFDNNMSWIVSRHTTKSIYEDAMIVVMTESLCSVPPSGLQ